MKKFTHTLFAVVPILLWLLISLSGSGDNSRTQAAAHPGANSAFEKTLDAHGGRAAIARATSARLEAVRLMTTHPTEFVERHLTVSFTGAKFRRDSIISSGAYESIEMFDGARLYAVSKSKDDTTSHAIASDSNRLRALRVHVDTFGLLPMLRVCADSVAVAEGRAGAFDKFRVATASGDWIVYTDQEGLIRRLEIKDKVFQFADYRQTGELRLPFIERLSVGDRLVYELIFSKIEINPDFPPDHFDPQALQR
ncbi:MAG: hypothetical protein AB1631_06930 [Acidobacteriota bacterium]